MNERAQELAEQVDDPTNLIRSTWGVWSNQFVRDDMSLAAHTAQQLLKKANLLQLVRYYRQNPHADTAPGILVLVAILSDDDRYRYCSLSGQRMARLLSRSENAISNAISRLEEGGHLIVERQLGYASRYWLAIPQFLTREVAQIGAVIERDFSCSLLRAVAGMEDAPLQTALKRLAEADPRTRPTAGIRISHQARAYSGRGLTELLKSRRQVSHRRVGEVLLDHVGGTAAAELELLAHHFTQAGLIAAIDSAYVEAGEQLRRALAQIAALPTTSRLTSRRG
jgi:hypothetical protein